MSGAIPLPQKALHHTNHSSLQRLTSPLGLESGELQLPRIQVSSCGSHEFVLGGLWTFVAFHGTLGLVGMVVITAGDFLVHHAIALGLHTTTLVLVKAAVNSRSSKLMPDKVSFGYGFPCDGPGRGGTCDISAFDGLYLAIFWMHLACTAYASHRDGRLPRAWLPRVSTLPSR